jgi:hypothetical protein
MADKCYRVIFNAQPIVVHASSAKQAVDVAIEYLRQPETSRIVVESADKGEANA